MGLWGFVTKHFQMPIGTSSHPTTPARSNEPNTAITTGLLILNFCMYLIVMAIAASVINKAISGETSIEQDLDLQQHLSVTDFPVGNGATGFFVFFALLAGVLGLASTIAGIYHNCSRNAFSMPFAVSVALVAWILTFLAMGFACKEIELRNSTGPLKSMEAFLIILTVTQFAYLFSILCIHKAPSVQGV